jgi:hypothetical protein
MDLIANKGNGDMLAFGEKDLGAAPQRFREGN